MKTITILELNDALAIIEAAQKEAEKNNWKVTIAVCDHSGKLLALQRLDGAPSFSAEVALEKAYCSVVTGKASGFFEESINGGRYAAINLPFTGLKGAEPIFLNGQCVGAVGVSGATADQDLAVAQVGLTGLKS